MTTGIPKVEYYYYSENTFTPARIRSMVNIPLLIEDLKRGVTTLSEDAYCKGWGSTQTSIAFATVLMGVLGSLSGKEGVTAKHAKMTLTKKHHYTLKIETFSGYTLVFKGVSGGYYGEGSRGAHDVLKLFGFDARQCSRVFERENFELRKTRI